MNLSFLTWDLPEQAGLPDAAAVARDAMPAAGHHPHSAPVCRCGRMRYDPAAAEYCHDRMASLLDLSVPLEAL